MATVDGTPAALADLLDATRLPEGADVLGPVPIDPPPGRSQAAEERERALVRAPREHGRALALALRAAVAVRTARKESEPVRVRLDPLDLV
jgi:primosomal protein N' (replication factor Y)